MIKFFMKKTPDIFCKHQSMESLLQKNNERKTIVKNCNKDHYFMLIKFISRGLISQYKLKNFQYQLNIILLKLADKFYHEIGLADFQKN